MHPKDFMGEKWESLESFDFWGFQWEKSEYQTEKMESLSGLDLIGIGRHRIVFDLNNGFVLKVAKHYTGECANLMEAKVFNECDENMEQYLARVIEFAENGKWLIMEKAEDVNAKKREITKLGNKIISFGWNPKDLDYGNVGAIDGKLVAIDYGDFKKGLLEFCV